VSAALLSLFLIQLADTQKSEWYVRHAD
jgi:hypothetical protein